MKKLFVLLLAYLLLLQGSVFAIDLDGNVVATPINPSTEYTEKEMNNDCRYQISVKVPTEDHGHSYNVTYYFNVKTGEIIYASVPAVASGNYITVPDTLEGFPVKRIGAEAFADEPYLCEVILPESIESIGENAFKECVNLFVVKMNHPENSRLKRIEASAFANLTRLFEAPIYDGLEYIGENAFAGTEALTKVHLPESLTHLGGYAFYDSAGLTDVYIPEDLSDIGANTFTYTPWLTEYDADFVVEGNYVLLAYKGTAKDVVLPNNILHLPDRIFASKAITGITFNTRLRTIGDSAFEGCTKLTSVTIPDTVRTIGDSLFKGCTSLTTAVIPSHLTEIPPYTFYETKITTCDLSKIVRVGEYAFCNSRLAGDLTLKSPMTYVENHAFAQTQLTSLTVTDNVYLDEASFSGTSTLATVSVDNTVKQMGGHVFYNTAWYNNQSNTEYLLVGDGILIMHTNSAYTETLTLPNTVKSIASHALTASGGYGTIILPDSITELGDHALSYSTANRIVLPDSLVKMGKGVFKNSLVTSVGWPKHLTEIPDETFQHSNLASFDFTGITAIGSYAFSNHAFKTVIIGDSVEKIGDYAFRGGTIHLHHLPAEMGEFPFGNTDTCNWNNYPEYYVDPDVFPYNEEEDYVILPDWVDYAVYITITPRIIESGEDYVVVKFDYFPPKALGAYYNSNFASIDKSHFSWVDESTIKISDILSYRNYSIEFYEHYSGSISFQYSKLKLIGMGRSDTSFTPEHFTLSNCLNIHTHNYETYYLTRCNATSNPVTVTFKPTTGQTFQIYKDEACTQYNGTNITLSYDPITLWVKTISENGKHFSVFPWTLEYYYAAESPSFGVSTTNFKNSMEISLSTVNTATEIYYTTDGSDPSKTNGTLYTGPFTITKTTLVKAVGYRPYSKTSAIVSKTYTKSTDMQIGGIDLSAKYVTLSLTRPTAIYNKYLTAQISTDGESWTDFTDVYLYEGNPTFEIDNLNPDTKYYLKLVLPSTDITSNVVEFTTKSYDEATGFSYDERGRICGMPEKDYIEIPETIAGKTIVGITDYAYRYVYGTISVPKTVTMISPVGINGSISFEVASDNPKFCSVDGSLYNKDMTKLIRAGFPEKSDSKEMSFIVPSTVKEIGDYAFYESYFNNIVFNEGLETIGSNVIYGNINGIIRIPSTVTRMGNNFILRDPAAVIFMGALPSCYEDTFHERIVLYSALENTDLSGIPVQKALHATSGFSSFFTPTLSNYTVEASWCSELELDETMSVLCRVVHTDGSVEILEQELSQYSTRCYFNTKSEVQSAKLFLLDMKTLKPLAASVNL